MTYTHLVSYPTPQGFQFRVKGRNHLTAKVVAASMIANHWTVEEAATNYNLCPEAVQECVAYYQHVLSLRGVS